MVKCIIGSPYRLTDQGSQTTPYVYDILEFNTLEEAKKYAEELFPPSPRGDTAWAITWNLWREGVEITNKNAHRYKKPS